MPWDIAPVLRSGVHGPADQPRAVPVFEQARNLPVGHNSPARDFQHEAIDFFKCLLVTFGLRLSCFDCPRTRGRLRFLRSLLYLSHRLLSFLRAVSAVKLR